MVLCRFSLIEWRGCDYLVFAIGHDGRHAVAVGLRFDEKKREHCFVRFSLAEIEKGIHEPLSNTKIMEKFHFSLKDQKLTQELMEKCGSTARAPSASNCSQDSSPSIDPVCQSEPPTPYFSSPSSPSILSEEKLSPSSVDAPRDYEDAGEIPSIPVVDADSSHRYPLRNLTSSTIPSKPQIELKGKASRASLPPHSPKRRGRSRHPNANGPKGRPPRRSTRPRQLRPKTEAIQMSGGKIISKKQLGSKSALPRGRRVDTNGPRKNRRKVPATTAPAPESVASKTSIVKQLQDQIEELTQSNIELKLKLEGMEKKPPQYRIVETPGSEVRSHESESPSSSPASSPARNTLNFYFAPPNIHRSQRFPGSHHHHETKRKRASDPWPSPDASSSSKKQKKK